MLTVKMWLEGFGLRQVWVLVPAPLHMADCWGQHPGLCEPVLSSVSGSSNSSLKACCGMKIVIVSGA